jgi:hypothetical protein
MPQRPIPKTFTQFYQIFDQLEKLNDMVIEHYMLNDESVNTIDALLCMLHDRRMQLIEQNADHNEVCLSLFTTMGILYGMKRNLENVLEKENE